MLFQNIKYESFEKFTNDVLSPSGQLHKKLGGFVYRGERTNKFKLLPGALRESQMDRLYSMNRPDDNKLQWLSSQIAAEYALLLNFYQTANFNGLKVPKANTISRAYNDRFTSASSYRPGHFKWIPEDLAELAALAQHYGVLTRLIDWSYELYVALYFASVDALKEREKNVFDTNDSMVIWALNAHFLQSIENMPLRFVIPAYYDNPNLNAQKGILSYWEIDVAGDIAESINVALNFPIENTDRTPLNELLQKHYKDSRLHNCDFTIMYKLEFPITDCIAAYDFLRGINYTAAKLFPGYSGVVRDMNEKTLVKRIKNMERIT